jgi:2'-5' RNA ligase
MRVDIKLSAFQPHKLQRRSLAISISLSSLKSLFLLTITGLALTRVVVATTPLPQRYSIVLVCNAAQRDLFVDLAHKLPQRSYAGYLLSERSLPHITLCQFQVDDERVIKVLKNELQRYQGSFVPQITGISFLPGSNEFKNEVWIEFSVLREATLIEIQNDMVRLLHNHNITISNNAGAIYRPHITLAKVVRSCMVGINLNSFSHTWSLLLERKIKFDVVLGLSDHNWQFVEIV